jgi:hypothetical protein
MRSRRACAASAHRAPAWDADYRITSGVHRRPRDFVDDEALIVHLKSATTPSQIQEMQAAAQSVGQPLAAGAGVFAQPRPTADSLLSSRSRWSTSRTEPADRFPVRAGPCNGTAVGRQ